MLNRLRIARAVVVVTCVLVGFHANRSMATELFASPSGSDTSAWTADMPLETFAGAQNAARRAKAIGRGPVTITFSAGTYYLPDMLRLMAEGFGTEQSPVIWRAAPGEQVLADADFTVGDGSPAAALRLKNFPMDDFGVTSPSFANR